MRLLIVCLDDRFFDCATVDLICRAGAGQLNRLPLTPGNDFLLLQFTRTSTFCRRYPLLDQQKDSREHIA